MSRMRFFSVIPLLVALALSACGTAPSGGQVNPDGSVDVNIILTDFQIKSSVKEFQPGVKYHFIVKNEGQMPHEFMLMPVVMQGMDMHGMSQMSMEDRDAMALMMIPEEQLPAGASVEAEYTFAQAQDDIEMVCTLQGHYEAGMHAPVSFR